MTAGGTLERRLGVGLLGCVTLVAALPPAGFLTGAITLAIGVLVRITTRPTRR